MSSFVKQIFFMKHITLFIFALFCGLPYSVDAQTNPQKSGTKQETLIRLTPQMSDTNNKSTKQGSKDKSINALGGSKKLTPKEDSARNYLKEGLIKAKSADYNGAIADFTKSLDLVKDGSGYLRRGFAYLMVLNYGAAMQDAAEALRLKPSLTKAYYIRGVGRYETGDFKGAKEDLDVFLEKDRTNASAFNYMAALLFMNQDFKGALINYEEVAKLDPKFQDVYTNLGMMRHYSKDYKGAVADYDEALKQKPDNATAYNNRGAARMMLKELDGAMADLNEAIKLSSKYAEAYDNRGRLKQELGDLAGACADWQLASANGMEVSRERITQFCK
jgi:Flp pilus assembly protein TadD